MTGRSGADLAALAAAFGDLLRAGGVPVTPERAARFAHAVTLADPATVDELYWLARVTLLDAREQLDVFDRAFAQVFRGFADVADSRGDSAAPPPPPPQVRPGAERRRSRGQAVGESPVPLPALSGLPGEREQETAETVLAAASTEERLRDKDFSACTPEEVALVAELAARMRLVAPQRPSRRSVRRARGRRLDVRRTLRRAHRTGGDPVRQVRQTRGRRPRRIVLIADVSGSMEAYSRVYLHLLAGGVRGAHAEAFVFATRLTRLTRMLSTGSPDAALARARAAAPDWSGGTRIGRALKDFLDTYGRRGVARGAVVVIVSDGWERDDPALLGEQMARLARLAHRVVWVNPRKAAEGFAPLVGGMAAALPHVDTFVSGHSLAALDEVLAAVEGSAGRLSPAGPGRPPVVRARGGP